MVKYSCMSDKYFAKNMVVFFAGGTGHPYFSTDTGVVLRAVEVDADVILLAKSIDGVYDADPVKPLGHHIVKTEAVPATCQAPGKTEGKQCDRCGKVFVAQKEIAQLEHKIVTIAPIAATTPETVSPL